MTEYLLDAGLLPTPIIRQGIRYELRDRLASLPQTTEGKLANKLAFINTLRTRPIAENTDVANKEHYEVDSSVFLHSLGARLKYSSCLYYDPEEGKDVVGAKSGALRLSGTLEEAEERMMNLYVERAQVKDGMRILDLGCGWGSLCLFLAEKFPGSKITALSNSNSQREFIEARAKERGISNLQVFTGDLAVHEFESNYFDRIISIELFEHMKNYEFLLAKLSRWLSEQGKLFIHIFAHKTDTYEMTKGWMAENFFSNGNFLSGDTLLYFQRDLKIANVWYVNGQHYAKTCEEWYSRFTKNKAKVMPGLEKTYGEGQGTKWFHRWQIFYLACAELFAYDDGNTWGVYHYLFEKP